MARLALEDLTPGQWASLLGYAGLVPFGLACLGALLLPADLARFCANALVAYGAAILSFLGGITWGLCVATASLPIETARREFLYSVCPSLLAWGCLLLPVRPALWLLCVGVALALAHDWWRAGLLELPDWFRTLRVRLSAGALVSLLLGALYA